MRRLIRYAFFDYDLMDVAYERAALTFETAVKKRHDELGGPHSNWKIPLAAFIKWAAKQNLFEDGRQAADAARELRNMVAHSKRNPRRGLAALQAIASLVRMINELYDDPELRNQRTEARDEANARFEEIVGPTSENGAVVELGEDRLLVFMATVLHVENRSKSEVPVRKQKSPQEPLMYLAFLPIFDPLSGETEELEVSRPVIYVAHSWDICSSDGASFRAVRPEDTEADLRVEVTPIQKSENRSRYQSWKAAFEETPFEISGVRSLAYYQLNELRQAIRNGDMIDGRSFEVKRLGSAPLFRGEASYTISGSE